MKIIIIIIGVLSILNFIVLCYFIYITRKLKKINDNNIDVLYNGLKSHKNNIKDILKAIKSLEDDTIMNTTKTNNIIYNINNRIEKESGFLMITNKLANSLSEQIDWIRARIK